VKSYRADYEKVDRAKRPEKYSAGSRKRYLRIYGLTIAQYEAMLSAQGGTCAICRRAEHVTDGKGNIRRLAVDHDHASGIVRSLLCRDCNVCIGTMRDDPDRMRAAAEYIERHRSLVAA